jgi:hypothetical protein
MNDPIDTRVLEHRIAVLEREHADLEKTVGTGFHEVNDRLDRIILVLLAGTITIIVFALGVSITLLTNVAR